MTTSLPQDGGCSPEEPLQAVGAAPPIPAKAGPPPKDRNQLARGSRRNTWLPWPAASAAPNATHFLLVALRSALEGTAWYLSGLWVQRLKIFQEGRPFRTSRNRPWRDLSCDVANPFQPFCLTSVFILIYFHPTMQSYVERDPAPSAAQKHVYPALLKLKCLADHGAKKV